MNEEPTDHKDVIAFLVGVAGLVLGMALLFAKDAWFKHAIHYHTWEGIMGLWFVLSFLFMLGGAAEAQNRAQEKERKEGESL